MAVLIYERKDSRRWSGESFELSYQIDGTSSDTVARALVLSTSPLMWEGLIRQAPSLDPVGPTLWNATVPYAVNDKSPEIGDVSIAYQTGGGSQHISYSKQVVSSHARPGEVAPNCKNAIGQRPDGTVEGIDIVVPQFRWTETYTINPGMLTWDYANTCAGVTGKVNNAVFRGFAAGEVMLHGVNASARLTGTQSQPELRAEISYEFAMSPNVANQAIGDIVGIAKKGWEYIDVRFEETDDAAANATVSIPKYVYVHRVYETANFGALLIGN